jgi:hypothetical protein
MEDSTLMDPRNWTRWKFFCGDLCFVRTTVYGSDYSVDVDSLEDVKPGQEFSRYYACGPPGKRCGPTYTWHPDRWLKSRSWNGPDSLPREVQTWVYYRTGELFSYWDDRNSQTRLDHLQEYFRRDGQLFGFSCGWTDSAGVRRSASYWMGKKMTGEGFSVEQTRAWKRVDD